MLLSYLKSLINIAQSYTNALPTKKQLQIHQCTASTLSTNEILFKVTSIHCGKVHQYTTRQKGGDLTQSYDKSPYTHGNVKRAVTTQTTPQKSSIKQRLRTDLGRSVGVTTATQLVWLTWFTGPTFPLPATAV